MDLNRRNLLFSVGAVAFAASVPMAVAKSADTGWQLGVATDSLGNEFPAWARRAFIGSREIVAKVDKVLVDLAGPAHGQRLLDEEWTAHLEMDAA